ncbi:MAG TPA: hypothetical protein VFY43_05910, partial [Candidatus Limnocylindria bacterium]|nr:hypothetical protein [Candidatus Limnocylindria bacterium]
VRSLGSDQHISATGSLNEGRHDGRHRDRKRCEADEDCNTSFTDVPHGLSLGVVLGVTASGWIAANPTPARLRWDCGSVSSRRHVAPAGAACTLYGRQTIDDQRPRFLARAAVRTPRQLVVEATTGIEPV